MDNITVRLAKDADYEIVRNLSDALGKQGLVFDQEVTRNWAHTQEGEKYFQERNKQINGVCIVAEINKTVVGFASGTLN